MIDGHFEGPLIRKDAYRWNGKEYTRGGLRVYMLCTLAVPSADV